jgi:regulator of cell morphogenesis and NO signaling
MKEGTSFDEMTVAEIVTDNIKTADIFKKNGIDFCCGGNILVEEVCKKKSVNYAQLKAEILALEATPTTHNYDLWDLDFLTDYIINTHHAYVTQASALVLEYSNKVAKVHGHHYSEVIEINTAFKAIVEELTNHMYKEEMVLFPYIKQLANSKRTSETINAPAFGTIQNPINMMELEHDNAGDLIKRIKSLSNNFTPPEGACNTFRALYAKLEEFQNDLFTHIHLENNILFPKAIELENEMFNS